LFQPDGGPGSTFFRPDPPLKGSVVIRAGQNRLGGSNDLSMGLLARLRFTAPGDPGTWSGTSQWEFANGMPVAHSPTLTAMFFNPTLGSTLTRTAIRSPFSWTTGEVAVYATKGSFTTILRRAGFDNRTTRGLGSLQLVAPQLTHWVGGTGPDATTGSIAIMRIVPEPGAALMLAVGCGALAILHRWSRRHGAP
jgi:hypothetical protein